MKAGLATSLVFHAGVLGFALFSLSAPRAFDVADVESLPIDIVPIEELTQIKRGDKKAPADETPAPEPTKRTDIVKDAENVGENDVDIATPPTPAPRPKPVETAAVSEPQPKPAPEPVPVPREKPVVEPKAEPTPVPATEVLPDPVPKTDVSPDPVPETAVAETPEAETIKLPDTAPIPQARPKPPEASTAKAPERKDADEPVREASASRKSDEPKAEEDKVAALLNREDPSGGGAKRTERQAALGGSTDSAAQKLTQGEMDALRSQLEQCWSLPIGMEGSSEFTASVSFKVDGSGKLEGRPKVSKSSGNRQFDESAVRAVQKCDRAGLALPKGKQAVWADIVVNFDPSEMF